MNELYKYNEDLVTQLTSGGNLLSDYGYSKLTKFKCVVCGSYLSPATLRYYKYLPNDARCYSCQLVNK